MSKILLSTLAFSNPDLLDKCLHSWVEYTPYQVHLGVLYQGYKDAGIEEVIKDYHDDLDIYLRKKNNYGYGGGLNHIFREAFLKDDFDAVISVGSDTEFLDGYWESFIKDAEGYDFAESTHEFNCFLITREGFNKVGYFDENIFNYCEDDDFRIRINKNGIKYKDNCGDHNLFKHFGSATVKHNPVYQLKSRRSFELNKAYMFEKWGAIQNSNPKWKPVFKTPFNNPDWPLDKWVLSPERRLKQLWHNIIEDEDDDRLPLLVNALCFPESFQYTNLT